MESVCYPSPEGGGATSEPLGVDTSQAVLGDEVPGCFDSGCSKWVVF